MWGGPKIAFLRRWVELRLVEMGEIFMFVVGALKIHILRFLGIGLGLLGLVACGSNSQQSLQSIQNLNASKAPSAITSANCPWNQQVGGSSGNSGSLQSSSSGQVSIESQNAQLSDDQIQVGQVIVGLSRGSSSGSGINPEPSACAIRSLDPVLFPQIGLESDELRFENEPKTLVLETSPDTSSQQVYNLLGVYPVNKVNTASSNKFFIVAIDDVDDLTTLQGIEGFVELYALTQAWKWKPQTLLRFEASSNFQTRLDQLAEIVSPSSPIYLGTHSGDEHIFVVPRTAIAGKQSLLNSAGFGHRNYEPLVFSDPDLSLLAFESLRMTARFSDAWSANDAKSFLISKGVSSSSIQTSTTLQAISFEANVLAQYQILADGTEHLFDINISSPANKNFALTGANARSYFLSRLSAGGGGGGLFGDRPDPLHMARIDQANDRLGREVLGLQFGVNVIDQAINLNLDAFTHPEDGYSHYTMGEPAGDPTSLQITHGNGVFGALVANSGDGQLDAGDGSYYFAEGGFAYLNSFYDSGPEFDGLLEELEILSVQVQNHSALSAGTDYGSTSAILDDIALNRSVLMIAAAGNSDEQAGLFSERSNAKNFLSVGAVDDANSLYDFADDQYEGGDHSYDFFSFCPEGHFSFGPTSDGRLKPDLVYFGQSIKTVGSNDSAPQCMSGTSASTALVSGQASYLFQTWSEGEFLESVDTTMSQQTELHPMTAKALLVNSAMQYNLPGDDVIRDGIATMPRERQGWGLVDLPFLMSKKDDYYIVNRSPWLEQNRTHLYRLRVMTDQPELKITLSFFDPGGESFGNGSPVVNNFDLLVIAPDGTRYNGNDGLLGDTAKQYSSRSSSSAAWETADKINNIENIFLKNPLPGVYRVYVKAAEINQGTDIDQAERLASNYSLVAVNAKKYVTQTGGCQGAHSVLPAPSVSVLPQVQDSTLSRKDLLAETKTHTAFDSADIIRCEGF